MAADTEIDGVGEGVVTGVPEGVVEGVIEGVEVNEGEGVTDGVAEWLGVRDGVAVGVVNGITTSRFCINWSKLVILILVKLAIAAPAVYNFSNTLVSTCGAVFSFTLT